MRDRLPAQFKTALQIVAVAMAAVLLALTTFYTIDLAFDLFGSAIGVVLNVAIIGVFSFLCWKSRYVLYQNLRI
jgi:hypothetical protein